MSLAVTASHTLTQPWLPLAKMPVHFLSGLPTAYCSSLEAVYVWPRLLLPSSSSSLSCYVCRPANNSFRRRQTCRVSCSKQSAYTTRWKKRTVSFKLELATLVRKWRTATRLCRSIFLITLRRPKLRRAASYKATSQNLRRLSANMSLWKRRM